MGSKNRNYKVFITSLKDDWLRRLIEFSDEDNLMENF